MTHTRKCNNVLIVEDEREIREAVTDALMHEGFRVTAAANGKDALELLRNSPARWKPSFILLDLMMPEMNGWEFLLAQRADPELKDIPVMICSAVADRAKFPGIVEFIKKPFDLDELIKQVSTRCDRTLGVPEEARKALLAALKPQEFHL